MRPKLGKLLSRRSTVLGLCPQTYRYMVSMCCMLSAHFCTHLLLQVVKVTYVHRNSRALAARSCATLLHHLKAHPARASETKVAHCRDKSLFRFGMYAVFSKKPHAKRTLSVRLGRQSLMNT